MASLPLEAANFCLSVLVFIFFLIVSRTAVPLSLIQFYFDSIIPAVMFLLFLF